MKKTSSLLRGKSSGIVGIGFWSSEDGDSNSIWRPLPGVIVSLWSSSQDSRLGPVEGRSWRKGLRIGPFLGAGLGSGSSRVSSTSKKSFFGDSGSWIGAKSSSWSKCFYFGEWVPFLLKKSVSVRSNPASKGCWVSCAGGLPMVPVSGTKMSIDFFLGWCSVVWLS